MRGILLEGSSEATAFEPTGDTSRRESGGLLFRADPPARFRVPQRKVAYFLTEEIQVIEEIYYSSRTPGPKRYIWAKKSPIR